MRLNVPVDPQRDHIKGPYGAPLSLVEYGDFQCPACGQAFYELREVRRRMPDEVQFVFRHFPLSQVHPQAVSAAEASEAAGAQGRFWQMHDMLFENQSYLEQPYLLRYARVLGLDVYAVEEALDTHVFVPRIREDFFGGVRSGANATPTIFINGRRHDGAWDAGSLISALEHASYLERPAWA
jgi:protein-disulfide isomerase